MKKIIQKVYRAIRQFDLIQTGDKILVAVSGGKDSLSLLNILLQIQKNKLLQFELIAVYVVPQVPGINILSAELESIFSKREVPYLIKEMKIPPESRILQGIKDAKTCQWCSYARRITLLKLAEELHTNKIAFGHHLDDIVNTLLINIQVGKNLLILPPKNTMKRGDVAFIRPLALIREPEIIEYYKFHNITPLQAYCPVSPHTQRQKMKKKLREIERIFPNFIENIFAAYLKKLPPEFKKKDNFHLKS